MTGLLDALDGDPEVDRAVDDTAIVRAMLDAEAALAHALAGAGMIPTESANAVTEAAGELDLDAAELGRRAAQSGTPVIPLVEALRSVVPESARNAVHLGATSQDIIDTALQLVAKRALGPLLGHLDSAAGRAAELAAEYRSTPALARTLGQPALPTTFGLRTAGWLAGLDTAAAELHRLRTTRLAVQLGGAAGTMSAYGTDGPKIAALLAAELSLRDPGAPWHTERSRVLMLGAALGAAVAACGKVGTDVGLLSQAEVGEVAEAEPGGSSAMPHKRNPARSVLVVAAARRAPGLVGTLFACGVHEQDRATGSWHAEWPTLRELLRITGGAAARTAQVLAGLHVDAAAMRRNLGAVTTDIATEPTTPTEPTDPTSGPPDHIGSAQYLVDRALTAYHQRTRGADQP